MQLYGMFVLLLLVYYVVMMSVHLRALEFVTRKGRRVEIFKLVLKLVRIKKKSPRQKLRGSEGEGVKPTK